MVSKEYPGKWIGRTWVTLAVLNLLVATASAIVGDWGAAFDSFTFAFLNGLLAMLTYEVRQLRFERDCRTNIYWAVRR